jgi:hypothetical protein
MHLENRLGKRKNLFPFLPPPLPPSVARGPAGAACPASPLAAQLAPRPPARTPRPAWRLEPPPLPCPGGAHPLVGPLPKPPLSPYPAHVPLSLPRRRSPSPLRGKPLPSLSSPFLPFSGHGAIRPGPGAPRHDGAPARPPPTRRFGPAPARLPPPGLPRSAPRPAPVQPRPTSLPAPARRWRARSASPAPARGVSAPPRRGLASARPGLAVSRPPRCSPAPRRLVPRPGAAPLLARSGAVPRPCAMLAWCARRFGAACRTLSATRSALPRS